MSIKYLKSAAIKNQMVFLRVDVNVPIDSRGRIQDDYRIQAVLPTIELLRKGGNKIILCGHLGRPEGKWQEKLSLKPVAKKLAALLDLTLTEADGAVPSGKAHRLIFFSGKINEEKSRKAIVQVPTTDIIFLENIRFYKGEEENDAFFAKQLASLADVYVNDAFSVSHRKAASVVGITKYIPSYAGLGLEKEIKSLDVLLNKSKKPFVVMMAGIKMSDKARTLEHLGRRADKILLGGGLANLLFYSKGYEVGLSKVEKEAKQIAWQLEKNFKGKIVLPVDVVVTNKNMDKDSIRVTTPYQVGKHEMVLDVGPKTILAYAKELKPAQTIVWNGPLGHFEHKPFHTATMALARVVGGVSKRKAFGVVGGGETVDAVRQAGQEDYIDHVSTGGGAMLEYLAGDTLPGIKALEK